MAAAEPTDGTALLAMLSRLASEPRSTVYLQPPASEAAIAAMQDAASRDLGEPVL
jgi:hypothetical protein